MEKLKVYINPACSKCQKIRIVFESKNLEIDWVNYLETPLTADELKHLLEKMNAKPSQVIRMTDEDKAGLTEEELFNQLVTQPALLNRPIVERENTAFLCRPLDILKEKMPEYDWSDYL